MNEVVLLEVVVTGGMARPITTHHQNDHSSDLFYSSEPFTRLLCISLILSHTQSEPDTFYFRFRIPFTFVGSSPLRLSLYTSTRVPRHLPLIVSRELNSASRRLHTRIILINSPFLHQTLFIFQHGHYPYRWHGQLSPSIRIGCTDLIASKEAHH